MTTYGVRTALLGILFVFWLVLSQNRAPWNENKTHNVQPLTKYDIYVASPGRLGNHLFNLASSYGISELSKKNLIIPKTLFEDISSIFYIKDILIGEAPKHVEFLSFRYGTFEKEKMRLNNSQDYRLGYYLQSYRYFSAYADDLREMLKIRKDLFAESQQVLHTLSNSSTTIYIGIHVRRGDLEKQRFIDHGYRMPKKTYIRHAMKYFTDRYKNNNIQFIICSDNLTWVKSNVIANRSNVYFSPLHSRNLDFALLTQCNHSIITVGTFGWWSAWLAGGDVIYYSGAVAPGSALDRDFTAKDYFWPTWIGMNDNGHLSDHI